MTIGYSVLNPIILSNNHYSIDKNYYWFQILLSNNKNDSVKFILTKTTNEKANKRKIAYESVFELKDFLYKMV